MIRDGTAADIDRIVAVHQAAFASFFLTSLGPRFLTRLYRGYLDHVKRASRADMGWQLAIGESRHIATAACAPDGRLDVVLDGMRSRVSVRIVS